MKVVKNLEGGDHMVIRENGGVSVVAHRVERVVNRKWIANEPLMRDGGHNKRSSM